MPSSKLRSDGNFWSSTSIAWQSHSVAMRRIGHPSYWVTYWARARIKGDIYQFVSKSNYNRRISTRHNCLLELDQNSNYLWRRFMQVFISTERTHIFIIHFFHFLVAHTHHTALIKMQQLENPPLGREIQFFYRKSDPSLFHETLNDIKNRGIYSIIIDTKPSNLQLLLSAVSSRNTWLMPSSLSKEPLFRQMQFFNRLCSIFLFVLQILEVQMNNYKYHYHFTTFDIESFNFEKFTYNFVNMTASRMVDAEHPTVRAVLRDMEKFQPIGQFLITNNNVIKVIDKLDSLKSLSYNLWNFRRNQHWSTILFMRLHVAYNRYYAAQPSGHWMFRAIAKIHGLKEAACLITWTLWVSSFSSSQYDKTIIHYLLLCIFCSNRDCHVCLECRLSFEA